MATLSALTLAVQLLGPHATAWHFFDDASRLLLGGGPTGQAGGLNLYRDRPDFQFGPLSILAAVPFSSWGTTAGSWLAMVAASAAGLLTLKLLLDTMEALRPGFRDQASPAALLIGGAIVVVAWGDVAVRTAHIDDAIALLAVVAAARWCAQGRPWPATVALAVAAAAKPWAVMFAPMALLPLPHAEPAPDPGSDTRPLKLARRTAERALTYWPGVLRVAVAGGLAALTWVPFVLAERQTLDAIQFGISNDPTSVLRALGVTDATTPLWARPAQLVGGMAIVTLLVLARRWPAALLAGAAWRLLLEPGANRYYTIGLVLGALLVELLVFRRRLPWFTLAATAVLELTAQPGFPAIPGRTLRLVCVVAALVAATRVRLPLAGGRPAASGDRSRL